MADVNRRLAENVPGNWYVDSTCINCDTCRQLAPETFGDSGEFSFVTSQPGDARQLDAARIALVACPTGSIGTSDKTGLSAAADRFPLPIAHGVSYCGFNSPKSFGGNSYFVEHPEGNWLIDTPRFVERLVRRFEAKGGLRYIFLTHRDDVADAALWARRFAAERIIHRLELASQPESERVIDGFDAVEVAPEFLAIPTPGHTRGHMALLYRNRFLFSGDHMWWSRTRGRLSASRSVCWYSWPEQLKSLRRLQEFSFEWVLPGHGQRVCLPADEIQRQVSAIAL